MLREATDRRKNPETRQYRRMTSAEVRALKPNDVIAFKSLRDDAVRYVRQSGKLKTWKTRPHDYRLPCKFGLYESTALVPDSRDPSLAMFEGGCTYPVVRVEEA